MLRSNKLSDSKNVELETVVIGNNVFIGAHTIIIKVVTISDNAFISAGSVVSRNVSANEIRANNPAKLIRRL